MSRSTRVEPLVGKINAVASMCACSPTTVRRWVREGVLPEPFRLRPGGDPLWWLDEVRARLARASGRSDAAA